MKWGIKGFEWTCKVLSPGQAHLNPYYQFLLQVIQSVYVWSGPSPLSRSPGPQPHLGFPSSCNKCWADSHIWVQDTVLCAWCKAWPVVPNAHLCSWFLDIWLPGSLHPCHSALTLATQDESFRFRQFLTDWAYPLLCVNFSSSTSPRPAFPRKGFLVPDISTIHLITSSFCPFRPLNIRFLIIYSLRAFLLTIVCDLTHVWLWLLLYIK